MLLERFIALFTRGTDKVDESKDWLYNIFTDEKELCRHYILLTRIHNDNSIFNTMKDLFGNEPQDGIITCKVCGEYLCPEDFSEFDGFKDDKPIQIREVLRTEDKTYEEYLKNPLYDTFDSLL